MMKRILFCAALLACIASAALAGGIQISETVEYFDKGDFASLPGVYTYGGSKRDWIHDMAVAPDGKLICAQAVGEYGLEDVLVTVVETE